MSQLCSLLGYSRQAFYGYVQHHSTAMLEEELVVQQVLLHRSLQPRIGTRKLMVLLQDFMGKHHISLGRDALFGLLRENGLLVRRRKTRVQTTFSKHRFKRYRNLIRDYVPLAANCLWVSDITYLEVAGAFAYLSLITDAYSKKIVGYHLSKSLQADGTVKALQMALGHCKDTGGLIHHSDRGIQYCCNEYIALLTKHSIKVSMTEKGDPLENAVAERVNGILKQELLQQPYPCLVSAEKGVAKAVLVYNALRPHSSCDMLTPQLAHEETGALKKHWKNYYKKKEVTMDGT
ncbi:IS3 family transposase [Parasediminibacterium sp. JCM 36343]|uniref:IS3 family transposase n=1 Tax=Parasediminibacterium sp. JCM 36343 TaxID=3374279 RepID=UPI0039787C5C